LYLWLAIAGAGRISLDYLLQRWYDRSARGGVVNTGALADRAM
jgi:hypothetical protein